MRWHNRQIFLLTVIMNITQSTKQFKQSNAIEIQDVDFKKLQISEESKIFGKITIFDITYNGKLLSIELPKVEFNYNKLSTNIETTKAQVITNKFNGKEQKRGKIQGYISLKTKYVKNKDFYLEEDLLKINDYNKNVTDAQKFFKNFEKTVRELVEKNIDIYNEQCVDESECITDFYEYTFNSSIMEQSKYSKLLKFGSDHFVDVKETNGKFHEKFTTRFSFDKFNDKDKIMLIYTFKKLVEITTNNYLCKPIIEIKNVWINTNDKKFGINLRFAELTFYPAIHIQEKPKLQLEDVDDEDNDDDDDVLLALTKPKCEV